MLHKAISKTEIARGLKVDRKTLSRLLNEGSIFAELEKLGYKKTNKLLYGKQLEVLSRHFDYKPE
jgi:hypothetical protein